MQDDSNTVTAPAPRRLAGAARRRIGALRDAGESGAQAAEYAMLGGVSAAACGSLVWLLKKPEFLQSVVEAIVSVLTKTVTSWF